MAMKVETLPDKSGIPQAHDRAIRLPEVIVLTGRSKTMIYADIAAGRFPAGFSIGPRARAWSLNAVNAWIQERMQGGAA
ncbi:MAG: AlpA family phage regulatory protein [Thiolinea sp.]